MPDSGFTEKRSPLAKAKAVAIVHAATRPAHELPCEVHDAFDRIKTGEFGEPAVAAEASIERFADESGGAPPILLFISDAEEAVEYSPEEARRLACDLLAMAEVSEAFADQEDEHVAPGQRWKLRGQFEAAGRMEVRILGPGDLGQWIYEYVVVNGKPVEPGGKTKQINEPSLREIYIRVDDE